MKASLVTGVIVKRQSHFANPACHPQRHRPTRCRCGVLESAVQQRHRRQRSLPDPPAEGFYSRLGFVGTGEQVPSRVHGGPLFSVYRLRL